MVGRSSSGSSASRGRTIAVEIVPFLLILLLIWAKVSYFNYPPRSWIENDWYPWYQAEAIDAAIGSLAALLILFSPLLLLRPGTRYIILCLLDLVMSLIVFGDVLHFRFYGDIMSASAASGAWQVALVWRSIVALLEPVDVLLFADIAVALALLPWYRRQTRSSSVGNSPTRRIVATTLFAAGCVLVFLYPVRIVRADTSYVFRYKYFRFFGARKIGLINYHLYEGGQLVEHAIYVRSPEAARERKQALSLVASWRPAATARSPLFGVARGKNLIVIMVESLQLFPVELEIDGHEVMPNMKAFAEKSLYFDRFFSQSADGTTSDGEFTSLQSLYPLQAGSVQTTYPTNTYRGIPRILAEHGYATMSAHAYYGDLFNMRIVHPRLGFQKSFFRETYAPGENIGLGLADVEFFRQTVPRMRQQHKPFMAFLITLSTHHDWKLPKEIPRMNVGNLEGTLVGNYVQSMNHFDAGFGELLDSLRSDGLLDQSVVVIYGDHKGRFGKSEDDGRAYLAKLLTRHAQWAPPDSGFDYRYWEAQNQLPLIIHLPHDAYAERRSVTAGHLDIAPTVLHLLGIDNSNMMAFGSDLTRGADEFVVFRNGSFVYGDTLCVTLDASARTAKCRNTRSGGVLEPARFERLFVDARRRLAASDVIISGNLIPQR